MTTQSGLNILTGFQVSAYSPIDTRYLDFSNTIPIPYSSTSSAISLNPNYRYQGMTILVGTSSNPQEYWWKNGTSDSQLILKKIDGSISGSASNGYVTIWSGTTSIGYNSKLYWDNSINGLLIGTNSSKGTYSLQTINDILIGGDIYAPNMYNITSSFGLSTIIDINKINYISDFSIETTDNYDPSYPLGSDITYNFNLRTISLFSDHDLTIPYLLPSYFTGNINIIFQWDNITNSISNITVKIIDINNNYNINNFYFSIKLDGTVVTDSTGDLIINSILSKSIYNTYYDVSTKKLMYSNFYDSKYTSGLGQNNYITYWNSESNLTYNTKLYWNNSINGLLIGSTISSGSYSLQTSNDIYSKGNIKSDGLLISKNGVYGINIISISNTISYYKLATLPYDRFSTNNIVIEGIYNNNYYSTDSLPNYHNIPFKIIAGNRGLTQSATSSNLHTQYLIGSLPVSSPNKFPSIQFYYQSVGSVDVWIQIGNSNYSIISLNILSCVNTTTYIVGATAIPTGTLVWESANSYPVTYIDINNNTYQSNSLILGTYSNLGNYSLQINGNSIMNGNINVNLNVPLDSRYSYLTASNYVPYTSTASACSSINIANRYEGLTVLVGTSSTQPYPQEFWWQKGISDSNLVLKQSSFYEKITKSDIDYKISNNLLEISKYYEIIGVNTALYGGTNIILQALSSNNLSLSGKGKFYNPKYNQSIDGYNIWSNLSTWVVTSISGNFLPNETFTSNNSHTGTLFEDISSNKFISNYDSDFTFTMITGDTSLATANITSISPKTYNPTDKVFWGGKVWFNDTGSIGTSIDCLNLNSDWIFVGYEDSLYDIVWDDIDYDYINDIIISRKDKNDNLVKADKGTFDYFYNLYGFNIISVFQWGNSYEYSTLVGTGNNTIHNSYCENINFTGKTFLNNSFSKNSFLKNNLFHNLSYFNNNSFDNNSSFYNNILINSSYLYNNNIINNSSIFNNIMINSNFSLNNFSNKSIYSNNNLINSKSEYNIISNIGISGNTMSNGFISYNSIENSSMINNNIIKKAFITYNNLNNNSYINNNILLGYTHSTYGEPPIIITITSSISNNTFNNLSYISNNYISGGINFNHLSTNSYLDTNIFTYSTIEYNDFSIESNIYSVYTINSSISNNTLNNTIINTEGLGTCIINTGTIENNNFLSTNFFNNNFPINFLLNENIFNLVDFSYSSNNNNNDLNIYRNTINNTTISNNEFAIFYHNIIIGSQINNNIFGTFSSYMNNNKIIFSTFSGNTFSSNTEYLYNELTESSVFSTNNINLNSKVSNCVLKTSNWQYINITNKNIRNIISLNAIINIDISSATTIFSSGTPSTIYGFPITLTTRQDGTPRLSYLNNSDIIVYVDLNS
jgi:hypothetical protein